MALTPAQQAQVNAIAAQVAAIQGRIASEGVTSSSGQVLLAPGAYNPSSGGSSGGTSYSSAQRPAPAPYTIKSGDTLSAIARANNTTVQALMAANPNIANPNVIYAGSSLTIPTGQTYTPATQPSTTQTTTTNKTTETANQYKQPTYELPTTPQPKPSGYTVSAGDTLSKIAQQYGLTAQELYNVNSGVIGPDPNLIRPGQVLSVPTKIPASTTMQPTDLPSQTAKEDQIRAIQSELSDKQAMLEAMNKYGVQDTNDLVKDETGNYISRDEAMLRELGLGDEETSLDNIIKKVSDAFGLPEIKAAITKLDDEYAQDVMEINENPWLSEQERAKQVNLTQAKYEIKKNAMYDQLKEQNTIVAQAINLWEAERDRKQQLLIASLNKKAQTTSDLTEYDYARSQGYTGSFLDWKKSQANLKTSTGGGTGTTTAGRVATVLNYIDSLRGADRLIAYETYVEAYNKWQRLGGTLSDFKNRFPASSLLDANNLSLVPEFLKPSDNNVYGFLNVPAPVE